MLQYIANYIILIILVKTPFVVLLNVFKHISIFIILIHPFGIQKIANIYSSHHLTQVQRNVLSLSKQNA